MIVNTECQSDNCGAHFNFQDLCERLKIVKAKREPTPQETSKSQIDKLKYPEQ